MVPARLAVHVDFRRFAHRAVKPCLEVGRFLEPEWAWAHQGSDPACTPVRRKSAGNVNFPLVRRAPGEKLHTFEFSPGPQSIHGDFFSRALESDLPIAADVKGLAARQLGRGRFLRRFRSVKTSNREP